MSIGSSIGSFVTMATTPLLNSLGGHCKSQILVKNLKIVAVVMDFE